jgi:hypothetical protein
MERKSPVILWVRTTIGAREGSAGADADAGGDLVGGGRDIIDDDSGRLSQAGAREAAVEWED